MVDREEGQHRRSREEVIRLNRMGREWLSGLHSVMRTIQFHESTNRIFDEPIERIVNFGNQMLDDEGRLEIRFMEDQFFLNGLWIKPTQSERQNLFSLGDVLGKSKLGGITVQSQTQSEHWRGFLKAYQSVNRSEEDIPGAISRALADRQVEGILVHPVMVIGKQAQQDLPLPPVAYASVGTYAKSLLALREFATCGSTEERVTVIRNLQRIVCDMIDLSSKAPRLFHLLSLFRNFDLFYYHHSVNASILAIALGREIGLDRKGQADLAMSTVLHDVGKLTHSSSMLMSPGPLSKDQQELIDQHPADGAKTFLNLGYLNNSVAERILVAFQHHWIGRGEQGYPKVRRSIDPSLMASLVGICLRFDSLISDKPYRKGIPPWQAIRVVLDEGEKNFYRNDLLKAFLALMGPLPVGSWVKLPDGREGISAVSGTMAANPPLPIVFVPSTGEWLDRPTKLKTKQPDSENYREALGLLLRNCEESPLVPSAS